MIASGLEIQINPENGGLLIYALEHQNKGKSTYLRAFEIKKATMQALEMLSQWLLILN